MLKTYTLVRKEEQQISDTEGKMIFHLTDENGDQRTVWGTTKLDENLNPVSISTEKKREFPLIQCLFVTNVNETINIEFQQYNTVFERKEMGVSQQTVDDIAKSMMNKPVRLGPLLKSTQIKTTETVH
jgi:hypothetical protein